MSSNIVCKGKVSKVPLIASLLIMIVCFFLLMYGTKIQNTGLFFISFMIGLSQIISFLIYLYSIPFINLTLYEDKLAGSTSIFCHF